MASASVVTESEILERIIASTGSDLSNRTARSWLEMQFPARDTAKIRRLLKKNNSGAITTTERKVLKNYLRIGQFLDLLHAKARLALAKKPRAK
jgi:hypothetical protein